MARKHGSHSEITGPKVQQAALKLIARHGCAAVSMRQIAADVGVQVGALYNYTADKQSLLFSLMETHLSDLLTALDAADWPDDPLPRLEAFTRFHIRFHLDRPDQVFVSNMELRNLNEENFAIIEGMRRRYERVLEDILLKGRDMGVFAVSDARIATMALIAMLTGLSNWYREDGRLPIDEIETVYWELVRKSVLA